MHSLPPFTRSTRWGEFAWVGAMTFEGNFMVSGQFSGSQFSSGAIVQGAIFLGGSCPGGNYTGVNHRGDNCPGENYLGAIVRTPA